MMRETNFVSAAVGTSDKDEGPVGRNNAGGKRKIDTTEAPKLFSPSLVSDAPEGAAAPGAPKLNPLRSVTAASGFPATPDAPKLNAIGSAAAAQEVSAVLGALTMNPPRLISEGPKPTGTSEIFFLSSASSRRRIATTFNLGFGSGFAAALTAAKLSAAPTSCGANTS